jgi:hypothetical protein
MPAGCGVQIGVTTPNVKNSTLRVGREIRWDQVTAGSCSSGGRIGGPPYWNMAFKSTTSRFANLPPSDGSTLISPGTTRGRQLGGSRRGTFRLLGRSRQHLCDSSALAYYS